MQDFILREGVTIHEFYQVISKELESKIGNKSNHHPIFLNTCNIHTYHLQMLDKDATFASVLLSAIDFSSFCDMMNDVREGRFTLLTTLIHI
jgi:hypothetical protein